jgi:hypothetical protein
VRGEAIGRSVTLLSAQKGVTSAAGHEAIGVATRSAAVASTATGPDSPHRRRFDAP